MFFFHIKDKEKSINQHISDIRKQLLVLVSYFSIVLILCFIYSKYIYFLLTDPLLKVLIKYKTKAFFITTSLPEGFITYVKMSFFIAVIICIPLILWQITLYITPIFIKKNSKKSLFIIVIIAPFLFYLGCFFAYFFSFNVIWGFFVKFAINNNIDLYLKISNYISLTLYIMIGLGICFELPIFIFILYKLNIVSHQSLKRFRRAAILIAFIVGAIITPPDPFSQSIMAIILILLYELSIFIIKINR